MRRLPAFTIVELCIVMLLSTIVVGMVFFTLNIFQGSSLRYKKEATSISSMALLHRLLVQDIWQSSRVLATPEGLLAEGKTGRCTYVFSPVYITREKNAQVDTFHVSSSQLIKKFQNQVIEVPGFLLDEISFQLGRKGEIFPFCFQKNYGADVLMQQETANN